MHKDECFVIAPIGKEGENIRKRTDQVFKFIIESAVEGKYHAVLAHKLDKPGKITMHIIEKLATAPLVIADLTDNNANVYYELALRHALTMPAILLIEEEQINEIPFDLKDLRVIAYSLHDPEKVEESAKELSRQIEIIEKEPGLDKDIFPEEVSLILEPNVPKNHSILLGTLLIANRFRYEVIEPYFEGLIDIEIRNLRLKSAFNRLMRESARKEYMQKNKILWAFTNNEYKASIKELFEDVENILSQLGIAMSSNDESATKEQLSKWRINNTKFFQIWIKQYEELLLDLDPNIDNTDSRRNGGSCQEVSLDSLKPKQVETAIYNQSV